MILKYYYWNLQKSLLEFWLRFHLIHRLFGEELTDIFIVLSLSIFDHGVFLHVFRSSIYLIESFVCLFGSFHLQILHIFFRFILFRFVHFQTKTSAIIHIYFTYMLYGFFVSLPLCYLSNISSTLNMICQLFFNYSSLHWLFSGIYGFAVWCLSLILEKFLLLFFSSFLTMRCNKLSPVPKDGDIFAHLCYRVRSLSHGGYRGEGSRWSFLPILNNCSLLHCTTVKTSLGFILTFSVKNE